MKRHIKGNQIINLIQYLNLTCEGNIVFVLWGDEVLQRNIELICLKITNKTVELFIKRSFKEFTQR